MSVRADGSKRTSWFLAPEVIRLAKVAAAQRGIHDSELVRRAILAFVKDESARPRRREAASA
jgi:hypothetical protein